MDTTQNKCITFNKQNNMEKNLSILMKMTKYTTWSKYNYIIIHHSIKSSDYIHLTFAIPEKNIKKVLLAKKT
jgi:hypothetical protein